MKIAASALLLVLALTGCASANGDSNPTKQSNQVPVPSNPN